MRKRVIRMLSVIMTTAMIMGTGTVAYAEETVAENDISVTEETSTVENPVEIQEETDEISDVENPVDVQEEAEETEAADNTSDTLEQNVVDSEDDITLMDEEQGQTEQTQQKRNYYNITNDGGTWDGTHYYDADGNMMRDIFFCDGTYTYYLQFDGTPMKDRLTYHPDGVHVIYFNEDGHETFNSFAHISKSIAGDDVDDYCYFDVYGYQYVDVLTFDASGQDLYYINPYGVMEMNHWFQFSNTATWGGGADASAVHGKYGYANWNGTLMREQYTYDWENRYCYMEWAGTRTLQNVGDSIMLSVISGTSSNTPYYIAVDTSRCLVGIFESTDGRLVEIQEFVCGPGKPSTPTVKGQFTITGKGLSFGSGYTCWYWTQFYGNYLFHSVLYSPGSMSVITESGLGTQVSHGCVRLSLEDAKWIYDNMPYGTRVIVF